MGQEQDERDIVEFSDEEGNTLLLEVMDYFFYNGEEFAVLCDADEEACDHAHDGECGKDCDCEHEHSLYIMKVVTSTAEDGEEMEEFISPEESMLEQLIEVVQARFSEEDDDIAEDDEEME